MPKTKKQSRRSRRKTFKRKSRKGGSDSQSLIPSTSAIKVSVPEPSNKIV